MHNHSQHHRLLLLLRCLCVLAACCAFFAPAQVLEDTATKAQQILPPLNLAHVPGKSINLDLRDYWRTAKLNGAPASPASALDPELIWRWPDSKFTQQPVTQVLHTQSGDRFVSRVRFNVTGEPHELILRAVAARLDAVHVAYRYDNGPWVRAAAGDKIAMLRWPFANYEPVFTMLARESTIDLVVEVAHQGAWNVPFLMQDSEAFYADRMVFSLLIGLLIGVNAVLALVATVSVWTFRRWSFWAVALTAIAIALQTAFCSGIAGMYLAKDSTWSNDEAKFFTNFVWCAILPWVTAVVIGQRFHNRWLWYLATGLGVTGVLCAGILANYDLRASAALSVPVFFTVSVGLSLYMLVGALRRQQLYVWRAALGVTLYVAALTMSILVYLGFAASHISVVVSSVLTMISALVFLNVLALQHRQGRMVMSRARASTGRDLLTGLHNIHGFSQALNRTVRGLQGENSYAVLFYVALDDTDKLRERYGDEGFEVSLVQIASSISSVVSVNDSVGRVAQNAFAICVSMPREPELANRYATKVLTRVMSLANHVAPLAGTARVAIAWIPTFGKNLPELQRRSLRAIDKLSSGKRIAWVGGAYAQLQIAPIPAKTSGLSGISSQPKTEPEVDRVDDYLPSLPGFTNPAALGSKPAALTPFRGG